MSVRFCDSGFVKEEHSFEEIAQRIDSDRRDVQTSIDSRVALFRENTLRRSDFTHELAQKQLSFYKDALSQIMNGDKANEYLTPLPLFQQLRKIKHGLMLSYNRPGVENHQGFNFSEVEVHSEFAAEGPASITQAFEKNTAEYLDITLRLSEITGDWTYTKYRWNKLKSQSDALDLKLHKLETGFWVYNRAEKIEVIEMRRKLLEKPVTSIAVMQTKLGKSLFSSGINLGVFSLKDDYIVPEPHGGIVKY